MTRAFLVCALIAGCSTSQRLYVRSISIEGRNLVVLKCPFGDVVTQPCVTEMHRLPPPRPPGARP